MNAEPFGRKWGEEPVPAHQARIDAVAAAARAGVAPAEAKRPLFRDPPKPPLTPSECLLDRRLEEEIDYVRRLLEAVGDRFADDPIVLNRHQVTLQSFDIIAQLLGHLAKVIGSGDRAEAVARIGMTELRARLTRPDGGIGGGGLGVGLQRSASNPFSD